MRFLWHLGAASLAVAIIIGLGIAWAHASGSSGHGGGPRPGPPPAIVAKERGRVPGGRLSARQPGHLRQARPGGGFDPSDLRDLERTAAVETILATVVGVTGAARQRRRRARRRQLLSGTAQG